MYKTLVYYWNIIVADVDWIGLGMCVSGNSFSVRAAKKVATFGFILCTMCHLQPA